MSKLIGVDVGGTFTDTVLLDEAGEIRVFKAPSTPQRPIEGIMAALELAAQASEQSLRELLGEVGVFNYGTTIAINAIVTGNLPKVGGLITRGFKDTLAIRRCLKGSGVGGEFVPGESLYEPQLTRPPALLKRSLTEEVTERVNFEGEILVPLDVEDARQRIRALVAQGVKGIAVCLLFSPRNPVHEQQVLELIREFPEVYENSSCSFDVVQMIREYERMSTTVLNVCLKPIAKPHLRELEIIHDAGLPKKVPVLIMQLHGGVMDAAVAAEVPVATVSSGPAGGVIGAEAVSQIIGCENVVTMDVGGTSFDVGVIAQGKHLEVPISVVAGCHIMLPMVDVRSIGAGGGSIARVEKGSLQVGPRTAGAVPGPACYDKGGVQPTNTDAWLILGYLNPDYYLGGRITLNAGKARSAIQEYVAEELHQSVEEAAAGIFNLSNANMIDAVRLATIERGYDPREFVGFVYGGAGGIPGAVLCREMGMKQAIYPWFATAFSAFGVGSSFYKHSYVRMIGPELLEALDINLANEKLAEMEELGRNTLRAEGVPEDSISCQAYLDMRFERQLSEITVPMAGTRIRREELEQISEAFIGEYSRSFTFVPDYPAEVVLARVEVIGKHSVLRLKQYAVGSTDPAAASKGRRQAFFGEQGEFIDADLYDGDQLTPGNVIEGPSMIEYEATTIVVRPKQEAVVDEFKNVVVTL